MNTEKIKVKLTEIESLEKEIQSIDEQTSNKNETLSQKNSVLEKIRDERNDVEKNLKAIGFFKFKERKPFKTKLAELDVKILESDKEIKDLKNIIETLSQRKNGCKEKIKLLQNEIDKLKKEQSLWELASSGDPKAQINLSNFYFEEKKQEQALEWLTKAAEQGNSQAQFTLAKFYIEKKNNEKTMHWLGKAAEQGNTDAKNLILQIEEDEKRIKAASYDITLW